MKRILESTGSSLVESMIAFVIIAGAAVAIFPMFTLTKQSNQLGDIKLLCNNYVRGKINEYIQGRPLRVMDEPLAIRTRLGLLSSESLSASNVFVNADPTRTAEVTASGFFYSKVRYNKYFPFSCAGRPAATSILVAGNPPDYPTGLPPNMLQLGMRECIGSNVSWDETSGFTPDPEGPNACATPLDVESRRLMPGFKLYVRLQLATPWAHMAPQIPTGPGTWDPVEKWPTDNNDIPTPLQMDLGNMTQFKDDQFSTRCPNGGIWKRGQTTNAINANYTALLPDAPGDSLYDFDGADDAIEVTVTGVIDLNEQGLANLTEVAGIGDPFRLYCQSSVVVRPMTYPVRYYVTNNGWIQTVQGRAHNRADDSTDRTGDDEFWAFPSLYRDGGGNYVSNILSVSVHPRNYSVYVLRPGSITRYGNCGGVPIDCNPINEVTGGIGDDGRMGVPSVQHWAVPSASIRHLSVDFGNPDLPNSTVIAYGMSEGQADGPIGASAGMRSKGFYKIKLQFGNPDADLDQVDAGVFPAPLVPAGQNMSSRLTGFFISPGGREAFITDPSGNSALGIDTYRTTIYKISDVLLEQPIAVMPFSGISFSK